MALKRKHEEHVNHESWAIPYGDLITLLLAFFVVMYSISSVNDGKYRVLSDALSEAFNGPPKSIKPLQFGKLQQRGVDRDDEISVFPLKTIEQSIGGTMRDLRNPAVMPGPEKTPPPGQQLHQSGNTGYLIGSGGLGPAAAARAAAAEAEAKALDKMSQQIQSDLSDLIKAHEVTVRRTDHSVEVEIGADILFPSGSADISASAKPVLAKLAEALRSSPNALRIEGHTDDVPIHTAQFPSNWELSAARAATVVHLFMDQGVDPDRMSVAGFGQYKPAADNSSEAGRNRNRRVVVVVLGEGADAALAAAGADHADGVRIESAPQPAAAGQP